MEYAIDVFSGKGGRGYNEDTVCAYRPKDGLIAIVADGLGMHGGGDIASGVAAQTLLESALEHFDLTEDGIFAWFDRANAAVLEKQTPKCAMKSTAAMLLCKEGRAAIAHVGDTRCYFFREGKITFQTLDHSVPQLEVLRGEIGPEQIRFHEDRNRLLRALGGGEKVRVDIELIEEPLRTGDAFLLCTDGFWEYVVEDEMEAELRASASPEEWINKLLSRLEKRVDGRNDNLSAIAVFCKAD